MRRLIFAAVLMVALVIPAVVVAAPPGSDQCGPNSYWNEFLARLQAGETPAQVESDMVSRYGGTIYPGQGPEQVLNAKQYMELILGQYEGSPILGNIDICVAYSPMAWLSYLLKVGPAGYVGVNSGQRDDPEYYRNLAIAIQLAAAEQPKTPQTASVAAPSKYTAAIAKLRVYIANLERSGTNPAKLALYRARLAEYLSR